MAEVDTSSYPKAGLPVNPLDTVAKVGQLYQQQQTLQRGDVALSKEKLDLINNQFGLMNAELSTLANDPSITKEKAAQRLTTFANTYKFPQEVTQHMLNELQQAPDVKSFALVSLKRGMDTIQKVNSMYGISADKNNGAVTYQGVQASPIQGGGFTPSTQMPVQVPPTTETMRPDNSKGLVGPAGPSGVQPYRGEMVNDISKGGNLTSPVPNVQPSKSALPVAPPPVPPQTPSFNDRFSSAYPTSAAPGVISAKEAVGAQSGKDYATALTTAKNYKADLYPAEEALRGIKELGVQGVGPGTDALNNVKSAIITWLPNADPKLIEGVGTFEQTRKYLTQIARSSGTTGTNDQLAAAFEANPSIKMSQAATENVLKSVIALRRLQHAQTLMFAKSGQPENEYSKWIATNQNVLDPRAFGIDMMSNEAKAKLKSQLEKDPRAYKRFEDTLTFAREADLIEPPARK